MNRKVYWGLGVLIFLLIGAGSFVFNSQYSQIQQLKQDTAEADKLLEEYNKPKVQQAELPKDRQPPPDASPHGHWHDGVWHDQPHITPATDDEQKNEPMLTATHASDGIQTADEKPSAEELARLRDQQLEHLPKQIESFKNTVASLEELYNQLSTSYQKFPDNQLIKQLYEQTKERLDHNRSVLSRKQEYFESLSKPDGLDYLISRVGLERR